MLVAVPISGAGLVFDPTETALEGLVHDAFEGFDGNANRSLMPAD
jgi:hypothetical protein